MSGNRVRIDEEMLGTLFFLGLAVAAFGGFGVYEFFTKPDHVLPIVGPGFLPLLAAGLLGLYLVATRTWSGAGSVLLIGLLVLGAAGVAIQREAAANVVAAAFVAGSLIVGRSLLVSYRRRAGIRAGRHSNLNFRLFFTWAVYAALTLNPATAVRVGGVLICLHWLITLGEWFDKVVEAVERWRAGVNISMPRPSASDPLDSAFEGPLPEPMPMPPMGEPESVFTPAQQRIVDRIAQFIEANYKDWGQPTFHRPIDSARYTVYTVEQPLTIKKGMFIDRSDDLATALGIESSKVMISQDRRGFQVEIAKDNPDMVHFDDAMARWENLLSQPLEIICGVSPYDEPVISRLDETRSPHTLTAGTTGSGKSVWLHSALVQLLLRNSPKDLQVLFADAGRTTAGPYADIPHLWRPLVEEHREMVEQLRELREERERRSRLFAEHKVQSLAELAAETGEHLPRILYVIDEAATLTDSPDAEAIAKPFKDLLKNLLENSRKFGIHIILGIQRPMVDTLGRGVRDLMARRIIFQLMDAAHSEKILDDGDRRAAKLRGYGDGIYKQIDAQRFQGMFIADKREEQVPGHIGLRDYIAAIIEKWGGPNSFGVEKAAASSAARAAAKAKGEFAAEHLSTVNAAEWAVLRALDLGMSNVNGSYDDHDWTPEGLMPFVRRVLPEDHPLLDSIDAEQVAAAMGRLFNPERSRTWTLNREFVEPFIARHRRITLRERDAMAGLASYIADTPSKPEQLRADRLLSYVNRPGADGSPRPDPLLAAEIEAAIERLLSPFARSRDTWTAIKTVIAEFATRQIDAGPVVEPDDAGPVKKRPSVADIAERPRLDR